jgi:hypothetical protein
VLSQGAPQFGGRDGIGSGQAVDHATDDSRLLAGDVPAGRDRELLGQGVCVSIREPAADQQDISIQRPGQRLVQRTGVQPPGPALSPSTTTTSELS